MKTYNGNVEIIKENQAEWTEKLKGVERIGGDLSINANAELKAPRAKYNIGGGIRTRIMGEVRESFRKHGYLFADGILSRIVSKRNHGEVIVYKTTKIGNSDKVVYVVQRGEVFSHGETVRQAIHDLRYKSTDRDTTKYEKWTLDSVHPLEQVISSYRAITGACEAGTRQWCEGKNLPDKLSVKMAIRATRGAYGAEKFKAFFSKSNKHTEAA